MGIGLGSGKIEHRECVFCGGEAGSGDHAGFVVPCQMGGE